jgi:ADP-ribose pyrophosphatase YjhB (NUDIX family)
MKFCSACGGPVISKIPGNDDRERFVCETCGKVHYQNPRIVTGCLVTREDAVLLCRRSIEPRRGFWTLPAGFMELGESVQQGAARETWEEARARVEILAPYSLFNLPHVNQLYVIFRARLRNLDFRPGPESDAVALYREDQIPWESLAFQTVHHSLRFYFEDRPQGRFPLRAGTISRDGAGFRFDPEPDDQLSLDYSGS